MILETQLAQILVISTITEYEKTLAICCPRMDMCRHILNRFYELHSELPDYLKVGLTYQNQHYAQTESGIRIILASDTCHLRGMSLSRAYMHIALQDDKNFNEWKNTLCASLVAPDRTQDYGLVWFA